MSPITLAAGLTRTAQALLDVVATLRENGATGILATDTTVGSEIYTFDAAQKDRGVALHVHDPESAATLARFFGLGEPTEMLGSESKPTGRKHLAWTGLVGADRHPLTIRTIVTGSKS